MERTLLPMVRTHGLAHLRLPVRDLDRSIEFYADVFGFEVLARREGAVLLGSPGAYGSLVLEPSSSDEPQITHFGLELVEPADLERAIALAVAGGGRLLERADHLVGGSSAVIADPSGHRISL